MKNKVTLRDIIRFVKEGNELASKMTDAVALSYSIEKYRLLKCYIQDACRPKVNLKRILQNKGKILSSYNCVLCLREPSCNRCPLYYKFSDNKGCLNRGYLFVCQGMYNNDLDKFIEGCDEMINILQKCR